MHAPYVTAFAAAWTALCSAAQLPSAHEGEAPRYGVVRTMLPPQSFSAEALAILDFDGNGTPDAYFAGEGRLYRNDGQGVFADESWRLPPEPLLGRDAAAGDVDGDGTLDLAVGTTGTDRLYLNRGGIFVDASAGLPSDPSPTQAVALGDVDGDADLDLWLGNAGPQSRLYLNDGSGTFLDATGEIPAAALGVEDLALGDVHGDGDLDAVLGVGRPCFPLDLQDRLYLNDGAGAFAYAPGLLPADQDVTADVVLCDVDLDLDLVLATAEDCSQVLQPNRLYLNDGAGLFLGAPAAFPAVADHTQACAVADADGDGDPDVLFGNDLGSLSPFVESPANRLCLNDGGVFSEALDLPLLEELAAAAALTDVDGDGDVDALLAGAAPRLHLNDSEAGFASVETVLPPDARNAIGLGDVDADGDLDALLITPLPSTLSFVPHEADQRLFLGSGAGYFEEASDQLPDSKRPAEDAAFGDVDADGDVDLLLACGYDGEHFPLAQDNLLYVNDGSAVFSDATGQLPTFVGDDRGVPQTGKLVDLDADGDLDALFAELEDVDGGGDGVTLFLNDGAGVFSDATDQVSYLGFGGAADVAAGDVDGDGDVDLVAGSTPGSVYLMLNDGTAHFTDATAQMPPLDKVGIKTHLGLGDLDGDLDLDLVLGFSEWSSSELRNLLYLNDGGGLFTDASADVPQVFDAYLLVDVDEDQDLDLLGGEELLLNAGGGVFAATSDLVPVGVGGARELGDVDVDGDVDALVTREQGQVVVWSNLTRHLAWRGLPRVGKPLVLDVYGTAGAPWLLAWSPAAAQLPLGPLGTLELDPALLAPAASGALNASGRAALRLRVPDAPGLVGLTLHWQALVGWPLHFTNREITLFSNL